MGVLQNLNFSKAISELLPKLLGEALHIVVFVTLVGFFAAIVFGFILALGRVSKSKILNKLIVIFQEFIRGTPLLVQMVYIYYVMPLFINAIAALLGHPEYKFQMQSTTGYYWFSH